MKTINTYGATYLEKLDGTLNWYWCTNYIHGDLYEAEELFNNNHKIKSNSLVFIKYPDGKVIEPIKPQDGQYFGKPIYYNDNIIILLIDFNNQLIKLKQYNDITSKVINIASIPLSEIKDCYNIMLHTSPLMLTRQGHENRLEIIYPNKMQFEIGNNESFCFRKDDLLYFLAWFDDEDEEYQEEVIIRDINTGDIIDKKAGSISIMPDGQAWLLI